MTQFSEQVFLVIKNIPRGKVCTYAGVAKALGKPRAVRAIGNILKKNKQLIIVPCHRVIKSNGEAGGYVKGNKSKKQLLKKEGIIIKNNKIDLNNYFIELNKI